MQCDDLLWMKIFEIIEANVHQWQEKSQRMPVVMISVNTEKMREQLFSLFKAKLEEAILEDYKKKIEQLKGG